MRLTAQRLGTTRSASPADAVRWMLAIQAQELPGAKWSLGLRTTGCTEAAVNAALDAGEVVRSWPLRGTLHLVAAEDIAWLLALTGSRQIGSAASRRSALGITDSDIGRAEEAVRAALAGRRVLPRDQLLARIRAAGVATNGQRGYHLIWHLANAGTLVMGAAESRGQAFALLEEWVVIPRALDRDEALGQLALRYLRSHGPADDADLARWAGIPLGEARRGRAICGAALATIELGGRTYHLDPETLDRETGALPPPATRAPCCRASTNTSSGTGIGRRSWHPSMPTASSPAATGCSGRRSSSTAWWSARGAGRPAPGRSSSYPSCSTRLTPSCSRVFPTRSGHTGRSLVGTPTSPPTDPRGLRGDSDPTWDCRAPGLRGCIRTPGWGRGPAGRR